MPTLNNAKIIKNVQNQFLKTDLPEICIGDLVEIGVKIIEGNKERIQYYQGYVIAQKNTSINKTITVRKVFQGIGIERIFFSTFTESRFNRSFTFITS